jgi:5-methylcytosine-specific restriction endonuclease McrBC GTP-binding regulatory subunit McrB
MIYSYLDTLLDKWVDWSEDFLSKKLTSNISDVNTILGTTGSDNPTRANEFFKIGILKLPLTGSNDTFESLRNDNPLHSDFGYLSYLIRKAQKLDETNQILKDGFKALSSISLIQQYYEYLNFEVSLNFIFQSLLEKYPIPPESDVASFLRYLSASMFCELDHNSDSIIDQIINGKLLELRLLESDTNKTLKSFKNSNDIIKAINEKVSLGNIRYTKGSTFFIGNHKSTNPRGLFYQAYKLSSDFLYDHYQLEKSDLTNNPLKKIFTKTSQINIFSELSSIFKTNPNYLKLMISLEQGCIEALNKLKWVNKTTYLSLGNSINRIYYGAPGTGKSHKVKELTKIPEEENRVERVTFHPEYDYYSFVGGYKPTMDGENIRYEFVPQAFTNIYVKAWNDLENDHYLIIEEINRGNCAEIFGDIFQLLDRTNDYKITPSKELKEYLKTVLPVSENIDAEKLLLPPNLNILATMNTSDQSLFPMDSAFKRRWDWEYLPICYTAFDDFSKKNASFYFEIDIEDGEKYSWIKFIEKINLNHIKNNTSLGMDKCIGNYFIKPDTGKTISLNPFINKVIFYLWNDVFKDEENKVFEENISYEDFFPINRNGKNKIKELFNRIELEPIKNFEIVEDDSPLRQVAEGKEESES